MRARVHMRDRSGFNLFICLPFLHDACKAIAAQKPSGACTMDATLLETLLTKLELAHFEALQQRGDEWEPEVQVCGAPLGGAKRRRGGGEASFEQVDGVTVRSSRMLLRLKYFLHVKQSMAVPLCGKAQGES
eukprot:1159975-Pelagomonas_calceolata.AAC.8